ncbi:MAG: hypothetical protein K0U98_15650 [Deltaproteobacteria bacterium]|nr:hypothetical protein [Deltaproteobacteria bacterium]
MPANASRSRHIRSLLLGVPLLVLLSASLPADGQIAEQVVDLFPTGSNIPSSSSFPGDYQQLGDRVVFFASTPTSGHEVWASDGSSAGTQLLFDICPGSCSSRSGFLAVTEEIAFFTGARIDPFGDETTALWRTDGTRGGTFSVLDEFFIDLFDAERFVTLHNDILYFGLHREETGTQLWRSDGTRAGTFQVSNVPDGHALTQDRNLQVLDDLIFFVAEPFLSGRRELWKSDGTPEGTALYLADDSVPTGIPSTIYASTNHLFFVSNSGDGSQLWAVDSQSSLPRQITQFPPHSSPSAIAPRGDRFYFVAPAPGATSGQDEELWESDGTTNGTRRISNLEEADPFPFRFNEPNPIERVGNSVVFIADDSLGPALWRTDGNPSSTERFPLALIIDDSLASFGDQAIVFGSADGVVFEPWLSDGTLEGTHPLTDLCNVPCNQPSFQQGRLGDELFFLAEDADRRPQLWKTDGSAEGTHRLTHFREFLGIGGNATSGWIGGGNDQVFLSISETDHGAEPWVLDDSPEGARLLLDISKEPSGSSPRFLTPSDDHLFFEANLPRQGGQNFSPIAIAKTRGDAGTTNILREFGSNFGPFPSALVSAGDRVFYSLENETSLEAWAIDPTTDAFTLLETFAKPTVASRILPSGFVEAGGSVFFTVPSGEDRGVWKTDGTAESTEKVSNFGPAQVTLIDGLQAVGNRLFFATEDNQRNLSFWSSGTAFNAPQRLIELEFISLEDLLTAQILPFDGGFILAFCDFQDLTLWRSDGSTEGTHRLTQQTFGCDTLSAKASPLASYRGEIFFTAGSFGNLEYGLWRSDGTDQGTVAVRLEEGRTSEVSTPQLAVADDRLFFGLNGDSLGFELWTSRGTTETTRLVKDIRPGIASSRPRSLQPAGDQLYFVANDGVHGSELWVTDGTRDGTRMIHDINPGGQSSNPGALTVSGERLYFTANDGLSGEELWVLPLDGAGPPCRASDTALCLQDGRFKVEMQWKDFQARTGAGQAVSITEDTGYFWFFNDQNVEAILKVLDGRPVNDHFWTFYGALSNVEYWLTVTDAETGLSRRYFNPSRKFASVGDNVSFGPLGASLFQAPEALESTAAAQPIVVDGQISQEALGLCLPSVTRLCLNGGRFAVEATWADFSGNTGDGQAVTLTDDTGYFWFFRDTNVETVLKVLDGRPNNGAFWVFYGSLSNVDFDLTVTDTQTGAVRTYQNRNRQFASVGDTEAFPEP